MVASGIAMAVSDAPVSPFGAAGGGVLVALRTLAYLALPLCGWGIGSSAPIKSAAPRGSIIWISVIVLDVIGLGLVAAAIVLELSHGSYRAVGVLIAAGFLFAGGGVVAGYVARIGSFGRTGEEDLRTEAEKIRERRAADAEAESGSTGTADKPNTVR
jgi:hypothetical protein